MLDTRISEVPVSAHLRHPDPISLSLRIDEMRHIQQQDVPPRERVTPQQQNTLLSCCIVTSQSSLYGLVAELHVTSSSLRSPASEDVQCRRGLVGIGTV